MLTQFNQFPPFLCVAIARTGTRRMSLREISQRSSLNYRKVERMSRLLEWDSVKVSDAQAFSAACGVDLLCPHQTRKYLRRQRNVKSVLSHLTERQLLRFTFLMGQLKAPPESPSARSEV